MFIIFHKCILNNNQNNTVYVNFWWISKLSDKITGIVYYCLVMSSVHLSTHPSVLSLIWPYIYHHKGCHAFNSDWVTQVKSVGPAKEFNLHSSLLAMHLRSSAEVYLTQHYFIKQNLENAGLQQSLEVQRSCKADLTIGLKVKTLSCVWLFATPWTIQSMEFSRPESWSE